MVETVLLSVMLRAPRAVISEISFSITVVRLAMRGSSAEIISPGRNADASIVRLRVSGDK